MYKYIFVLRIGLIREKNIIFLIHFIYYNIFSVHLRSPWRLQDETEPVNNSNHYLN